MNLKDLKHAIEAEELQGEFIDLKENCKSEDIGGKEEKSEPIENAMDEKGQEVKKEMCSDEGGILTENNENKKHSTAKKVLLAVGVGIIAVPVCVIFHKSLSKTASGIFKALL